MGKRTFNIKVGAITTVMKLDRILFGVFKEMNNYKRVSIEGTETVLYWWV